MNKIETLQPDRLKQQVHPGNSPLVLDLPNEDRTEELVDRLIIIIWSKDVQNTYNNLPKGNGNSAERKRARNLVTLTAERLLKNPQDISIAESVWRTNGAEQHGAQEPKEPFSKLVREKILTLIKDKWETVAPEQLAQLVRISADNDDPSQDFAKKILTSYFNRPESRSQRIHAYYTFASSLLDLVGDDRALEEGIRIAYHDTDILPKDPHLIEQTIFFSLPYDIFIFRNLPKTEKDLFSLRRDKNKEKDFQRLSIAKVVFSRLVSMGSKDLEELHQREEDFIHSPEVTAIWEKEQVKIMEKIGEDMLKQLNGTLYLFFNSKNDTVPDQANRGNIWISSLLDNSTDPLYQKFERVFYDQLSRSSQVTS